MLYQSSHLSSDSPRNLALHGEAWQSSDGGYEAPASFAFDGNTDGNYYMHSTSHTGEDDHPFIAVDLKKRYRVGYVLVTNVFTDGMQYSSGWKMISTM